MSKLVYFIFVLQFAEMFGMQGPDKSFTKKEDGAKKIIAVVNALQEGVYVQIHHHDDNVEEAPLRRVWLRSVSTGRIAVTPPRSPSTPHLLVIKDSHDTKVLAQIPVPHPEENATYGVVHHADGITVQEISTLGVDPRDPHHK